MKLAVALTFPAYPPLGGGQVRVYNLYRELARTFEIELVTLAPLGTQPRRTQLAPGLWETQVPKSVEHATLEMALEAQAGTAVTDVAMYRLYRHTPAYLDALRAASDGAAAVVASHPFTYAAIRAATDAPLCYEAHNVEAVLKAELLGGPGKIARSLLKDVEECERECCRTAELVWTCSSEDRSELIRRYGADPEKVIVVPNGAALEDLVYRPPSVRREYKRRLRMEDRLVAVFVASWHEPNVVAALRLLDLAAGQQSVDFLILGSVGQALADRVVPTNVQLMGPVSAGLKQAVLGTVDVALNPVTTGSGTNIKMLDYFGSGVPVISTPFGARGLGVQPEKHYLAAEPVRFDAALARVGDTDLMQLDAMVLAARQVVESEFSWRHVATGLESALRRWLDPAHEPRFQSYGPAVAR